MRVLFLTPRDSKRNLGGVERHVRLVTEELVRRGHSVNEIALDKSIKETPCSARSLLFKLQAWRYLWRNRELFGWAEVVHVHDVFWWVMPFVVITKITNIREKHEPRLFVTFHGWEGKWPPTKSAVWQKRLAARLSDGTIGVGDFYEKWYGVKTDRVVWGVLDKNQIESSNRETPWHTPRSHPIFAFFGRLEEVNGIEIVIEALNKIYKSYKDNKSRTGRHLETSSRSHPVLSGRILSIIFVGDGSWRKQAEKVGKVTGMVAEPWKYLEKAEVVIASSYLAISEAMAMGKPVIAVANNPLKEDYLEGHPLRKYFKVVGDAEELAREILHNGLYKGPAFGYKGRAFVLGQTAGKLADVYEELWNLKSA